MKGADAATATKTYHNRELDGKQHLLKVWVQRTLNKV